MWLEEFPSSSIRTFSCIAGCLLSAALGCLFKKIFFPAVSSDLTTAMKRRRRDVNVKVNQTNAFTATGAAREWDNWQRKNIHFPAIRRRRLVVKWWWCYDVGGSVTSRKTWERESAHDCHVSTRRRFGLLIRPIFSLRNGLHGWTSGEMSRNRISQRLVKLQFSLNLLHRYSRFLCRS